MRVPSIIAERFELESVIGKGGMGTVYKATQLGLQRPVAVKLIKPEFAFNSDITDRFMREARTMAKLRHHNAAMIFDAGTLRDGRHFIVMEYVKGITLAQALNQEKIVKPERAVKIVSEICDVLEAAHRLGIVHRDLKPSNIMLTEEGIRVLDFGVAKVIADVADATTTCTDMIIGTPRYMSPEQCMGQKVGTKSDIYSLGVLLYEMLAGHPPFTDKLLSVLMVKQATIQPQHLGDICPDLPPQLVKTVHAMLAKCPENRPTSAKSVRSLLERSITKKKAPQIETTPFADTIGILNIERSYSSWISVAAAFVFICLLLLLSGRDWTSEAQTAPASGMKVIENTPSMPLSKPSNQKRAYKNKKQKIRNKEIYIEGRQGFR